MDRYNILFAIQMALLIIVFVAFTYGYDIICSMSCVFLGLICIYVIVTVNRTRKKLIE